MNEYIIIYDEFSKALHNVSEKINELSDTFNDFAAQVAEAWQKIFSESMYYTHEDLSELDIIYKKLYRKKSPRPFYKREYDYHTYEYIKTFKRNLPYHRRSYQ